jgi:hypothetical protein
MPRLPKDYTKIVIYKLVCNDLNILGCYVGHTTDFTRRKAYHKSDCNNENGDKYNYKIYKTIRENGGFNNYSMIEIEKYPCRDENEATARERHWFEILNSGLNTNVPNRSRQEYYEDNRAEIRQYNADHKEEKIIYNRQYREDNRAEIRQYREDNRAETAIYNRQYREDNRAETAIWHKQHYADNRDNILIKQRQYYEDHREEIITKNKQTFTCECGKTITWCNKTRHLNSKIHKQYMERIILASIPIIPVVPPITDTQFDCGICHIPLDEEEFENTKQQKDINDDHLYLSNHYDFMHSHAI